MAMGTLGSPGQPSNGIMMMVEFFGTGTRRGNWLLWWSCVKHCAAIMNAKNYLDIFIA